MPRVRAPLSSPDDPGCGCPPGCAAGPLRPLHLSADRTGDTEVHSVSPLGDFGALGLGFGVAVCLHASSLFTLPDAASILDIAADLQIHSAFGARIVKK